MKSSITFPLTLSILLLCPLHAIAWSGKVVKVSDGDAITVLHDGQQERVRLYGIDAPEKKQAFGQRAHEALDGMVAGKVVEIDHKATDRYGRTVGMVTADGQIVDAEMVRTGYAWVYRQYCKGGDLRRVVESGSSRARAPRRHVGRSAHRAAVGVAEEEVDAKTR
ncbi:MAG: thermonuclease family protein [Desulfobulbus sp.]|nr:thermonuclease family protein [Desulfobulbus sp.]